jgi:flagellar hook-basal body complex protein FliE
MSISIKQMPKLNKLTLPKIQSEKNTSNVFSDLYNSAINVLDEANNAQKAADKASIDLALGKIDNVDSVMIAQEKADIALQYTIRLRDKILDSYNDIMRMQV